MGAGLAGVEGVDPGSVVSEAQMKALFGLGVHSVIDQLEQLADCLADIRLRRLKGEKP